MQRTPVQVAPQFPFEGDFQRGLLRLLLDDMVGAQLAKWVEPHYFTQEPLAWAWGYARRYIEEYGIPPTLRVLLEVTRGLDPQIRPLYAAVLEETRQLELTDVGWLKDQALDFLKRQVFVRSFHETKNLYNTGQAAEAYDRMMEAMEEIRIVAWELEDRGWLFDELPDRMDRRHRDADRATSYIATGIQEVDKVLGGGLSPGELGIWIAYAKVGKSTMLINLGATGARQYARVLHIVLEGSRQLVEDRYDSLLMEEVYHRVKRGEIDAQRYRHGMAEYEALKRRLVVRGLVERWDYNVVDVDAEVRELSNRYGWKPDLLVVDYGDLLNGRGNYRSETENQQAAFRDLKTLANRGYALWTASQARRPKGNEDLDEEHWVRSKDIADCYGKVRVGDFLGTMNQTQAERDRGELRLLAELYRDNAAGLKIHVRSDWTRMKIHGQAIPETVTGAT